VTLQKNHFPYRHMIVYEQKEVSLDGYLEAQCFPLLSLLLAANLTEIDYFSLDVEGLEYLVLENLHWTKLHIKVSL